MPLISLTTNTKFESEDAKKEFIMNFSKFCAKTVDKEEEICNVNVCFNPYLMYGGTFEPAIMLKIVVIGNVNPVNSRTWSKEFSDYFKDKLGVPSDRGLMVFTDPGPAALGTKGTTLEALWKA